VRSRKLFFWEVRVISPQSGAGMDGSHSTRFRINQIGDELGK